MIDKLTVTVPFDGDELYEIIKLYDILREWTLNYQKHKSKCLRNYKTQKSTEDFSNGITNWNIMFWCIYLLGCMRCQIP